MIRNLITKLGAILMLGASLLGACTKTPSSPPQVSNISVQPSTTILIGDTASLMVTASSDSDMSFEWSLQGPGSLADSNTSAVVYTAPNSPGKATVVSV